MCVKRSTHKRWRRTCQCCTWPPHTSLSSFFVRPLSLCAGCWTSCTRGRRRSRHPAVARRRLAASAWWTAPTRRRWWRRRCRAACRHRCWQTCCRRCGRRPPPLLRVAEAPVALVVVVVLLLRPPGAAVSARAHAQKRAPRWWSSSIWWTHPLSASETKCAHNPNTRCCRVGCSSACGGGSRPDRELRVPRPRRQRLARRVDAQARHAVLVALELVVRAAPGGEWRYARRRR